MGDRLTPDWYEKQRAATELRQLIDKRLKERDAEDVKTLRGAAGYSEPALRSAFEKTAAVCERLDRDRDFAAGSMKGFGPPSTPPPGPSRATTIPDDATGRKQHPVASGVLDYFPDAIVAVAAVSWKGNEQHNPGTPLHWDRSKSTDEADALVRHFLQRGTLDSSGTRHSANMAWRALALLQKEIEAERRLRCDKCGHIWGAYEDTCHCQGPCHNTAACQAVSAKPEPRAESEQAYRARRYAERQAAVQSCGNDRNDELKVWR